MLCKHQVQERPLHDNASSGYRPHVRGSSGPASIEVLLKSDVLLPAGSIPRQWFVGNGLRVNLWHLGLALNSMQGSIPAEAVNAGGKHPLDLVIAPMNGPGLCGMVPLGVNAISQDGKAAEGPLGYLPAGACPGEPVHPE